MDDTYSYTYTVICMYIYIYIRVCIATMTWGDHGDDIRIYNQESGDISPTIERLNVLRSLQELSVNRFICIVSCA